MARRRRVSRAPGPSENLRVVAIIFVATTVVALGASLLLYSELRHMGEEVEGMKRQVNDIRNKHGQELERAENFAEKCLGDRESMPDGLDKVLELIVLDAGGEEGGEKWHPASLVDLVAKLRNRVSALEEEKGVVQRDLDDQRKSYSAKQKEMVTIRDVKEQEVGTLRADLENERSSSKRMAKEFEERLTSLQEANRDFRRKLTEQQKAHKDEVEKKNVEIENLNTRIEQLMKPPRPVAAFFEFDGRVLNSNTKYSVATINLGMADGVRPGFIFEVYPPGRPKRDKVKGKIEVMKVNENTSTCRIVSHKITEPLLDGDYIYNPTYNPRERESFTLIGYFESPYNAEKITTIIKKHGGIASREISDDTDYVVLGINYEREDTYKRARELGIEILRVDTLRKFFGER